MATSSVTGRWESMKNGPVTGTVTNSICSAFTAIPPMIRNSSRSSRCRRRTGPAKPANDQQAYTYLYQGVRFMSDFKKRDKHVLNKSRRKVLKKIGVGL